MKLLKVSPLRSAAGIHTGEYDHFIRSDLASHNLVSGLMWCTFGRTTPPKTAPTRSTKPTEWWSGVGSEAGPYLRLKDSSITQLTAQGPSRTCNESREKKKKPGVRIPDPWCGVLGSNGLECWVLVWGSGSWFGVQGSGLGFGVVGDQVGGVGNPVGRRCLGHPQHWCACKRGERLIFFNTERERERARARARASETETETERRRRFACLHKGRDLWVLRYQGQRDLC